MDSPLLKFSLASALLIVPSAGSGANPLSPHSEPTFVPALTDRDEAENLSGAACIDGAAAQPVCLLVGDEKRYARFFTIKDTELVPLGTLDLLAPSPESKAAETDAEGVAYDAGYFYVLGSHSANKKGEPQPSRHRLFRVKVDQRTGTPTSLGPDGTPSEVRDLDAVIAAIPALKPHIGEAPGEGLHGVNLEGIAVSKGNLYIGLRGPVVNGKATILSLPINFRSAKREPVRSCELALGEGQGVRDLLTYRGGLIILAGPEMRWNVDTPLPHSTAASQLFFWDGGKSLRRIGELPVTHPDGPEAIALLGSGAAGPKLLLLSDGPGRGRAAVYEIANLKKSARTATVTCFSTVTSPN